MKAAYIALMLVAGVAVSGCTNLRARSLPAKPLLQNPCAVPPPCGPAAFGGPMGPQAPQAPYRTLEK